MYMLQYGVRLKPLNGLHNMSNTDNRILLHILKHNPTDGEVYITWEGETFRGVMSQCEVSRRPDEPAQFVISGYIMPR